VVNKDEYILTFVCISILTDHGICLMEVFVITVRIPQIGILFIFCLCLPTFCVGRRP